MTWQCAKSTFLVSACVRASAIRVSEIARKFGRGFKMQIVTGSPRGVKHRYVYCAKFGRESQTYLRLRTCFTLAACVSKPRPEYKLTQNPSSYSTLYCNLGKIHIYNSHYIFMQNETAEKKNIQLTTIRSSSRFFALS